MSECPTPCDADCDATCHELHVPTDYRSHPAASCPGVQTPAERECEQLRALLRQVRAEAGAWVPRTGQILRLIDEAGLLDGGQR